MGLSAGVFFHNGLGDGVNCLVLSHNLHLNGWKVDTYQNMMGSMQNWFPHLRVYPYPKVDEVDLILETYDRFFVVHDDSSEFVLRLIQEGKRRFPERIKVIYFYPSKNIVNDKYYADCLTNPNIPVVDNLCRFCEKILHLPMVTRSNGFTPPEGLVSRKYEKRVVIHPTSAKEARNWPKEKFLKLAKYLKSKGFQPVFIPGTKEGWDEVEVAQFSTLDSLGRYIYESGYLIGNDSGLGHLASAIGVPTLIFCRGKRLANLWAPSYHPGIVLTPSSWIPNIRGLRLRDRYWKKFISVWMAKRAFNSLSAVAKSKVTSA